MRALVKYESGPGNVALCEIASPATQPGHVLIDVAYGAVCGTDRLAVEGGHDFHVPRTLGHEASGVVAALGAGLRRDDLQVGTRVTVETDAYLCMRCEYCLREEYNRCPSRRGIGTTADGALAEQLSIPERAVHALPDSVGLLAGALTEPLAIAVHAVIEQSPSLAGQVVVVIGPGAIGQLCAQVAHAVGATVVLVGRSRHLETLRRLLISASRISLTARPGTFGPWWMPSPKATALIRSSSAAAQMTCSILRFRCCAGAVDWSRWHFADRRESRSTTSG
ncbi:alcohol dehydrogenase catalytic domain-containing protein [Mycolicibacterium komossense]|uniref:Alcohol dehydrogenase catalytic domain-containing protein n=1 Tax=Mycolicibacterium komossense TaxID=1779 RepID=A0ABT3C6K4_9MYCO|nr:alcohol dehydrogenase catalytic domain-containing protein [Mycolicibacterium komossense]